MRVIVVSMLVEDYKKCFCCSLYCFQASKMTCCMYNNPAESW